MAHDEMKHDYHILEPSIWPILGAIGGGTMLGGGVLAMHGQTPWVAVAGLLLVLYVMFCWWRDVVREGNNMHDHTPVVRIGLRYGMILFITSEVFFFLAWFWAFYHFALFPPGDAWPPADVTTFNPWRLPLINTLILLTSGATCTWAHHSIMHEKRGHIVLALLLTIALGILFTITQAYEYSHAQFDYAGHFYGATFFMATGFHGFHVIVGTLFLTVCLVRAIRGDFTPERHIGFEAAAWYWHFVDVVWLLLFASVYVWAQ